MWGRQTGVGLVDTEEMAVFFERLDHVNQEQLLSMRAAWHSTSREAHEEAWAAVRAVGVREGLTNEIDRVRKKALGWVLRGTNAVPFFHRNDDVRGSRRRWKRVRRSSMLRLRWPWLLAWMSALTIRSWAPGCVPWT